MVIGTLAYWHISTLKFNFGNTDAVIVQHDAEVAGGSAFERIGNQFAVFADGARIYGEELSATARELDFEGCRQVVVTCKGDGNFIYLGSVLQGKGNIISLISLPCGIDFSSSTFRHPLGWCWHSHALLVLGFNGFGTGLVVFYGQRSVQADVFGRGAGHEHEVAGFHHPFHVGVQKLQVLAVDGEGQLLGFARFEVDALEACKILS